jgi:DNA-binding transcriptional MerR regulator
MKDAMTYSIGELAVAAGVSRRTVRFYVQLGLLPAPLGLGRGASYGAEHLAVLLRVKQMQLQGVGLAEIGEILTGRGRGPEARELGQLADQGPDPGPRNPPRALTGVVGDILVRQALAPGYDLFVTKPGRPLDQRSWPT